MSKQELIEEAAAYCQARAYYWTQPDMFEGELEVSRDAGYLAGDAYSTVCMHQLLVQFQRGSMVDSWALAAAMLLNGEIAC